MKTLKNAFLCKVERLIVNAVLLLAAIAAANVQAEEVLKSPNDTRSYLAFKLANGLRVIVVSDPDAVVAAASMDVHVGSGDNPPGREGLAHFLEHMLFLGTEKYPNADEYQSFIKANGGSNNAYTSFDHTNYYFSISPEFFEPALDRFSRFFIASAKITKLATG